MINTILFDLDGTLLPMDTEAFVERYFKELSIKLKDYFTHEELVRLMWKSTEYMVRSTEDHKTNEDVFFESFYKDVNHNEKVLTPLFDEFYREDFDRIKTVSEKNEHIIESVNVLKQKGYKLVVATNPLFPKTAILSRIEWAGLNKDDFILITNFEDMHFCKPNLYFYEEILNSIDKEAKSCLMVGNDIREDMIAKEIGIKTYLIDEFVIGDMDENENIDYRGNYKDFYNFTKELPNLI